MPKFTPGNFRCIEIFTDYVPRNIPHRFRRAGMHPRRAFLFPGKPQKKFLRQTFGNLPRFSLFQKQYFYIEKRKFLFTFALLYGSMYFGEDWDLSGFSPKKYPKTQVHFFGFYLFQLIFVFYQRLFLTKRPLDKI